MTTGESRSGLIAQVFGAQYTSLCRVAFLLTRDAAGAEEIVMDVFAGTLGGWRRFETAADVSRYVQRGVVNRCLSYGRRRRGERVTLGRLAASTPTSYSSADVELSSVVQAAIDALPSRQRAAVVLTYYLDLDQAAAAQLLKCSVGTVKSQLSKARRHLESLLAKEYRNA